MVRGLSPGQRAGAPGAVAVLGVTAVTVVAAPGAVLLAGGGGGCFLLLLLLALRLLAQVVLHHHLQLCKAASGTALGTAASPSPPLMSPIVVVPAAGTPLSPCHRGGAAKCPL